MATVKLFMWECGGDTVIAIDEPDAKHEWFLHVGGDVEDAPGPWAKKDPSELFTVWCDENLHPGEVDNDTWPVTMAVAQWIKHHGCGYLCSEDV